MKVSSIKESTYQNQNTLHQTDSKVTGFNASNIKSFNATQNVNSVAFKSAHSSDMTKRLWLQFRKLSDYMKQPSEMTNALIAMIGTGAIAPFAIMCSPKKKCCDEQDKKVDKDKKFFQALRQPVSAFLAFAFQVPTTVGIAMGLNHLAYKKHAKFFDDEILHNLIPDKKYLRKEAKSAMKENAKPELKEEWAEELRISQDKDLIKSELKNKIKKEYLEVDIDISDEELERLASKKKKLNNFIADKMADARHEKLINAKVQELANEDLVIKDTDLVTENYQNAAKQRYKEEFANLRKEAKLNWFDKFIEVMGFSNKKLNTLNNNIKAMAQEKGLNLIRDDIAEGKIPDVINDKNARLRNFIENRIKKAKKLHANKIFWITLCTNLFMVAISCVALNWLHPKFADVVDHFKDKKNAHKTADNKKVEVRA